MSETNIVNIAIIGAGPAGYTAGIYASRANLEPLLFEGLQPGGQLTTTTEVENYPGFDEGIMGPNLMEVMKKQAARFGTKIISAPVDSVDLSTRPFKLVSQGEEYLAKSVIIATGATARYLGLESETEFMGRGVSACATCDGPFYNGRKVLVVGGGDSAMEEAIHLTKFADKVYIIHRRDELRASKVMQKRAMDNPKIEIIWNSAPIEVLGDQMGVTGARLKDTVTGEEQEIEVEGFFLGIGHTPNTEMFKGQIDLFENGFVKTAADSTKTTVDGVFACGDVQDQKYQQAITAAGTGCMSALEAEEFLLENE